MRQLLRGDVWRIDLEPVRGHEQGKARLCVIVSTDTFNNGGAGLIVIVPATKTARGIPLHVRVDPPEGGLTDTSYFKCEDVRSLTVDRLLEHWGTLGPRTMQTIEDRLRILLNL